MCDAAVWEHQAAALSSLATIGIADHGSLDSLEKMAEAILARAPERFALAGHSMGGRVAFEVLRLAPERVTAVALMDTGHTPRRPGVPGEREAAGRYALLDIARKEGTRAMGRQWLKPMIHPDRLSDETLILSIVEMIGRKSADIFAAQTKALLDRPDASPLLSRISCPALVLCGRQDSFSPLSVHEEMARGIQGSRLVVIENSGHMSTMERPEAVTAAMEEWLTCR